MTKDRNPERVEARWQYHQFLRSLKADDAPVKKKHRLARLEKLYTKEIVVTTEVIDIQPATIETRQRYGNRHGR